MDPNDDDPETSVPSTSTDDLIDLTEPLVELLSSVLRLANRPAAATRQAQQPRRFSDADRSPTASPSVKPEPIAVRSRDGSRWLPAPDEQTRTIAARSTSTGEADPTPAIAPLQQHACNAAVCAVAKLFETTELLELVLNFVSTKDILSLRRTATHWNATIKQSPQLRLHFFHRPEFMRPADEFQLLPLNLPGLVVELGEPLPLGQWIQVSFTPEAARKLSHDPQPTRRPRSRSIFEGLRGGLGARAGPSTDPWPASSSKAAETANSTLQYEDLFVTQPPVVGMQAFIDSTHKRDGAGDSAPEDEGMPAACAKLSCDAGITLGFLAETAQSFLTSNKLTGDGGVKVVFKAIVSFCTNESAPRKRSFARSVTRIG